MKKKLLLSYLAIAALPAIGSAQTNIQLKSGEVLYHNIFPLSDSPTYDIFKTNTTYANTVIMSNLIAGVMYGELIKQKYPNINFNKDYLYNSLIGQLMQESDMTTQINNDFQANDPEQLIDNSTYAATLLNIGQGGPYQINDYSKRLPANTDGALGLVNYNSVAKILGYSITDQDNENQTKAKGPTALENIYSGPMITAFYHFNDINRMNINSKQDWYMYHQQWHDCLKASQDPNNSQENLAFPFVMNVVYNAGPYSEDLRAYLNICSNPQDQQTYSNIDNWNLGTTDYQKAIGVDSPSSGEATYYRYPRQVSFYINQILDNNSDKLEKAGVSADNQVIFKISDLKNVFAMIMHKLSYRDSDNKLQFISADAADEAFDQALELAAKAYGQIPNELDFSNNPNTKDQQRQIIYYIIENAIKSLAKDQNIDFAKTYDKKPGPAPKPKYTYPDGIGNYEKGTVVKAGDSQYQCLVAGWCNQPAYSPTGAHSSSAWKNLNPPKPIGTWDPTKAYKTGETVIIDGITYQAQWWTQGDNPVDNSGKEGKPWKIIEE